jgi:hypothetical protein
MVTGEKAVGHYHIWLGGGKDFTIVHSDDHVNLNIVE